MLCIILWSCNPYPLWIGTTHHRTAAGLKRQTLTTISTVYHSYLPRTKQVISYLKFCLLQLKLKATGGFFSAKTNQAFTDKTLCVYIHLFHCKNTYAYSEDKGSEHYKNSPSLAKIGSKYNYIILNYVCVARYLQLWKLYQNQRIWHWNKWAHLSSYPVT